MSTENRREVSVDDIMDSLTENYSPEKLAELPWDYFRYKAHLYKNLTCPSYVHGYSLAIEFMKKWFISKFPKDYFKWIHINGKHVLDDWKHFNNYNVVREKPMLAITPTVDYEWDRENLDQYMMDQSMLLKRSDLQQAFFKDYKFGNFLYMQPRELKMEFNFKVRVNSRSQQLDLFNMMELWFKIGATQYHELSADFHVPYDIMLNIASSVGFEIKDNHIVNVYDFLSYLNKHSDVPFIFKMRAINQKPEFFIRIDKLYTHISTVDKLQLDDGERQGKLDNNFHVELRCTLKMPIPQFYVYFCEEPIRYKIGVHEPSKNCIGVYSINANELPPENEKGWNQLILTGYMTDDGEQEVDLSQLLYYNGTNVKEVIKYNLERYLTPSNFLDIRVYKQEEPMRISGKMDWENCKFIFDNPINETNLEIVVYADKEYINNTISTIKNYSDSRITNKGNSYKRGE